MVFDRWLTYGGNSPILEVERRSGLEYRYSISGMCPSEALYFIDQIPMYNTYDERLGHLGETHN
jgi:hypothetical protein